MILIPTILLAIFYFIYQKTNKGQFGIISLLFITYLTSSILGAVLYYSNLLIPVYSISFNSMFYLTSLILLTFLGFSPYKDYKIETIKIDNIKLLNLIGRVLLYGSIFSILFFLPLVFKAFQGNINENRLNLTETMEGLAGFGLINSFASLFANLFMLTQMFFFLNLIPNNGLIKKRKSIIMLLSSMSYIIYVLAYVGRDGVVFWFMSFFFQYLFFKKFIDVKIRKNLKAKIFIFALIMAIPFILITLSRFSASPLGVYVEIINYMGQQLINFNDQFEINAPLQMGNFNFPVVTNFLRNIGFDIPVMMDKGEIFSYFLQENVLPWTFSTFIGTFMLDFGKIGTIIIILLLFFFTYNLTKRSVRYNSFPISNYILLILFYQTVYFGIFYFRLYSANFYIIAMILIYIILKLKLKNKQSLILTLSQKK